MIECGIMKLIVGVDWFFQLTRPWRHAVCIYRRLLSLGTFHCANVLLLIHWLILLHHCWMLLRKQAFIRGHVLIIDWGLLLNLFLTESSGRSESLLSIHFAGVSVHHNDFLWIGPRNGSYSHVVVHVNSRGSEIVLENDCLVVWWYDGLSHCRAFWCHVVALWRYISMSLWWHYGSSLSLWWHYGGSLLVLLRHDRLCSVIHRLYFNDLLRWYERNRVSLVMEQARLFDKVIVIMSNISCGLRNGYGILHFPDYWGIDNLTLISIGHTDPARRWLSLPFRVTMCWIVRVLPLFPCHWWVMLWPFILCLLQIRIGCNHWQWTNIASL